MSIADRIIVMRQGETILEGASSDITEEALIHAMAGYVPQRQPTVQ
jgi:ABC-type sugar transport system ATPase subunit